MKGQNRKLYPDIINHCYQRTINGDLIFYNVYDCLLFFTIFCVQAPKYGIRVYKLCLMPDHIHNSSSAKRKKDLSDFTQVYTAMYAREHNIVCNEKGSVFQSPFGSAPKYGDKKARSNLIYVDNNPVERHLVEKAEDYRWNFLAYAKSNHPFSKPLELKEASKAMKTAIEIVDAWYNDGKYLSYFMLRRMFSPLSEDEKRQLVDYVVTKYNILDYEGAAAFFDGYENMLIATHSVTGSEHDLNEVFVGKSDEYYNKMTSILMNTGRFKDIHDVFSLSIEDRMGLLKMLNSQTDATLEQIAKYLHIPFKHEKG